MIFRVNKVVVIAMIQYKILFWCYFFVCLLKMLAWWEVVGVVAQLVLRTVAVTCLRSVVQFIMDGLVPRSTTSSTTVLCMCVCILC